MQYSSDEDDELISAKDLLKMVKRARKDYKEGKVYKLRSLWQVPHILDI